MNLKNRKGQFSKQLGVAERVLGSKGNQGFPPNIANDQQHDRSGSSSRLFGKTLGDGICLFHQKANNMFVIPLLVTN